MQVNICERFPCLSPFDVRKQRFSEVLLLIRRLNNQADKKGNGKSQQTKHYEKTNGKTRVYVPVIDK